MDTQDHLIAAFVKGNEDNDVLDKIAYFICLIFALPFTISLNEIYLFLLNNHDLKNTGATFNFKKSRPLFS